MRLVYRQSVLLAVLLSTTASASAQTVTDTTAAKRDTARAAAPAALPFEFSGVLFANYQYGGAAGARSNNRFDLERAYLTFRAAAGERTSVRVTPDVFQQTASGSDAYYRGWAVRLKYAYADYELVEGKGDAMRASVRLGMLQTPIIELEEQVWIRGLGPTAVDQTGFFSSADLGATTTLTLPDRLGELLLGVYNGNGYQSRETDRFKDYGARLTLAPFAKRDGLLKGFSVSPWIYKGATASRFLAGQGTLEPVRESRRRDRYGVLLAVREPRFQAGVQLARRTEEREQADTTIDLEPLVSTHENSLLSAHTVVRPFSFTDAAAPWPISLVARIDRRGDRDADTESDFRVLGIGYDLSRKATVWLDWQSLQPRGDSATPDTKTWFLHAIVNF